MSVSCAVTYGTQEKARTIPNSVHPVDHRYGIAAMYARSDATDADTHGSPPRRILPNAQTAEARDGKQKP